MNSKAEKPNPEKSKRERQDWLIVLLILLLGFCCVLVAGQYALRFAPSWQVETDMESNIDLDSEFLTNKPSDFFEPVDPAILTQPGWVSGNVFLTPGASGSFLTGTPLASNPDTPIPSLVGTTAVATNTLVLTETTVPTNTLVWIPLPATATSTRRPPPADTPTDTPLPAIDLEIVLDDGGVAYSPGGNLIYTIIVTNNSAFDVSGATVTDIFGAQITGASWTCVPSVPAATCTNGAGNPFSDVINLPALGFVTYTVTVNISGFAVGPLSNAATVNTPAFEIDPGDNTDTITTAGPSAGPGGEINIGPPNGSIYTIPPGGSLTMVVSPVIVANGDGAYDLVYYEMIAAPPPGVAHIELDWVQIYLSSDGTTWFPVFDWGDGISNTNSNVALPVGGLCPTEVDNCDIPITLLYNNNSTGVAIDIDSIVPPGNYPWILITSPASPDGSDVDSIQILP